MLESGTDPEAYITEYTLVYEDKKSRRRSPPGRVRGGSGGGAGAPLLDLQGCLAHKKQPPPLGPPWGPSHIPTVGS